MLGDSLLVAPVFHASSASYYIPSGKWTCFWSNEVIQGPKWVKKDNYPLDMIPVFVRPNSVLLLGPEDIRVPDYDYEKTQLEVKTYALDKEVVVDVPGLQGEIVGQVKVKQDGQWEAGKFKLVKGKN
jgi:alpha-glucosidase (family GH31 glycosyl hydrolase)